MKLPFLIPTPYLRALAVRIAAVIGAGVVFASIASAYVLEGPKWSGSTVTFQFRLGNANRTLSDGNTSWDLAALPAPESWNQNIGSVHFDAVVNPSAPLSSGDGINSIGFSNSAGGQSFGSSTLAITLYYYSGNRMSEADVFVNNRQSWDSYRGALRFGSNGYAIADIQRVLTHELGHALGLNHPPNGVDAIMHASITNRDALSGDDIRGAQALYGLPSTSSTPTPTPSATPNPNLPTVNVTVAPGTVRIHGSLTFTFAMSAPQSSPVTVSYSMSGASALYTMSPVSQVTIPAGDSTATATLTAIRRPRRGRSYSLVLNPSSEYNVGSPSSARFTVAH